MIGQRNRASAWLVFLLAMAAPAASPAPVGARPERGPAAFAPESRLLLGFQQQVWPDPVPVPEPGLRRPWMAGLEVVGLNLGVWALDRYVLDRDYARVGFSSWAYNFRHGFIFDPDTFGMNFFSHPYSGANYFNAARSLGLNFWQSVPYTFGGSLLWEMFAENQQPSVNDLVMTTSGGVLLGEMLFRLSSLVLDDTATGAARVGREALALLIDPVRGLNRLIYGDAFRTSSVNRQFQPPVHGAFGFRGYYVSETSKLSDLRFSPGVEFEFIYGESTPFQPARGPFDLMFLNTSIRHIRSKIVFNLNAYALLYGNEFFTVTGQRHLLGFFQNFDFINNELIELGGSSLTAGIDSTYPLGSGLDLRVTAQLGAMLFGASNNKYTQVEERDYNYGLGSVGKFDIWLNHRRLGRLNFRWGHYQIYTIEAAALAGNESQDVLTVVSLKYGLTFWKNMGLRLEYTRFSRKLTFEGRPGYETDLSQLGGSIVIFF
jgi:hypothetical protein